MSITIDDRMIARLLEEGVSTLHGPGFGLPMDCKFEPPCSLKWMQVQKALKLGAFSYAVSGYYFDTSIGRYTSIGEDVQIGRGSHPVSWASTSPVFYQGHEDVVGLHIPAAVDFETSGPYVESRITRIGNDVYVGHGAFIKQGVTVGDGAVIGALSVVTKDVPSYAIVAGSPATIKRMRFAQPTIERMERIRWWRYAFWDLKGAPVESPDRFLDFVEKRVAEGIVEYDPQIINLRDLIY